jgi:probable phosphoglycerate mutase
MSGRLRLIERELTIDATRVLAIRHGETDWNVEFRLQGQRDVPLNARGQWQAERLTQALRDERLGAVYSSDLSRAMQTAEGLARGAGLAVLAEPGLRERAFGEFEGCTYDEIHQRWPDGAERWRARDEAFGPTGGESLRDFYERVVATARRLAARHPGEAIAWVTHGGVLDGLYRVASGIGLASPRTWRLGNAAINRLLCSEERITVVGWNDDTHLDPAAPIDAG